MIPHTTSYTFPKTIPAVCRSRDTWNDLDIAGHCFWLGLMYTGVACFEVGGRRVKAIAPCFLCFDDRISPRLVSKRGVRCDSIYFDPTFINVNMTSARVHGNDYDQMAAMFDLFILKPFTDEEHFVFPLFDECLGSTKQMFGGMEREFSQQTDWFWSCRSRSYFMELIFLLEYAYNFSQRIDDENRVVTARNVHLQKALLYIGAHFAEGITLLDIVRASGINHTTLTHLFRDELGMTPVGYLWHHRIQVAAKQLEFTALPIKDIAARCGFQTVQHFSRKFRSHTGETPSEFRTNKLRARMENFGQVGMCRTLPEERASFSAESNRTPTEFPEKERI